MSIAQLQDPQIGGNIPGNLASLAIQNTPVAAYVGSFVNNDWTPTPAAILKSGPYVFSAQLTVSGSGINWTSLTDGYFVAPLVNGSQVAMSQIAFSSAIMMPHPISQDTRQVILQLKAGDVVSSVCQGVGTPNFGTEGSIHCSVQGLLA